MQKNIKFINKTSCISFFFRIFVGFLFEDKKYDDTNNFTRWDCKAL